MHRFMLYQNMPKKLLKLPLGQRSCFFVCIFFLCNNRTYSPDFISDCYLFDQFSSVPRVCDACKETEENDNEIVDNLCKNDFGEFSLSDLISEVFFFFLMLNPRQP